MPVPRRTPWPAVACAAGLLALPGCSAKGLIDFSASDTVVVDLVVAHSPQVTHTDSEGMTFTSGGGPCSSTAPGWLTVEPRGTDVAPACRLHGAASSAELQRDFGWALVSGPGLLALRAPTSFEGPDDDIDIELRLPGPVLVSGGLPTAGHSVFVRSAPGQAPDPGMVVVVARTGEAPDAALLVGAATALVGSGLGLLLAGAVRRRRSRPGTDVAGADPVPADDAGPPPAVVAPDPPEDPSVWAARPGDDP